MRKKPTVEALSNALEIAYRELATSLYSNQELLEDVSLARIARKLGLVEDRETIDALFILVDAWCSDDFSQFARSFRARFPEVGEEQFSSAITSARKVILADIDVALPNRVDWCEWGLDFRQTTSPHQRPLDITTHLMNGAAAVVVAAFTGWRASELGFSRDDAQITENNDMLDQQAFPIRVHLSSKVPKTHGESEKVEREISYSTYRIIRSLQQLKGLSKSTPIFANRNKKFVSRNISSELGRMWFSFVHGYKPFRELKLSGQRDVRQSESDPQTFDSALVDAWYRAREEFDRVYLFLNYRYRAADARNGKEHILWDFNQACLPDRVESLFCRYLSAETQDRIKSLADPSEITLDLTRFVTRELVSGCLYPSPHAFRHMWAEAVYRRFDGDVGWMIRSNFKHVSRSMWRAYVRNKDHVALDGDVRARVISSLVYRVLTTKDDQFAGQFSKKVRRIYSRTAIAMPEGLRKIAKQFSETQVSDFTATPWGYCMLVNRNRHLAKCAEQGQPRRARASPRLCMSCGNYLIQKSNVDYVVLHLAKDLAILTRPSIPSVYRRSSYKTVKAARKISSVTCARAHYSQ